MTAGHREDATAGDRILIGEIVKPHGTGGEVKVLSYSGEPENFKSYGRILLQTGRKNGLLLYKIISSRTQGKMAILTLEGVKSRDAAAKLQGCSVWLLKEDLAKPGPEEYYWHQLENLQVITDSGRELGTVTGLFRTPAHDIMVVTGRDHEYMIPVKADIIGSIDEQKGQITVFPPDGLLDINM